MFIERFNKVCSSNHSVNRFLPIGVSRGVTILQSSIAALQCQVMVITNVSHRHHPKLHALIDTFVCLQTITNA